MPTPSLPSATSVTDYLKGKGEDSSYSARSKIYRESGLSKTLGDYVGSASQNVNLLKHLQSSSNKEIKSAAPTATSTLGNMGVSTTTTPTVGASSVVTPPAPATKTPALNVMQIMGGKSDGIAPPLSTAMSTTTPQTITPQVKATDVVAGTSANPTPPQVQPTTPVVQPTAPTSTYQGNSIVDYLKSTGKASDFTSRKSLAEANGITGYTGSAEQNTKLLQTLRGGGGAAPTGNKDTDTQAATGGVSSSTVYPDTKDDQTGESDLINDWLNSPEGKLFTDKQNKAGLDLEAKNEETKAALESKYAGDLSKLEENLAANGLAFSGIRATKVKALADSLAASLIGADRELASKLLDANLDLREAVLKGVADLAKKAADGRKEAIQQLNAVGYAVIDGKLVPTLASRSAERADAAAVRAERSLELSEARLALSERAADRAEKAFLDTHGGGEKNLIKNVRALLESTSKEGKIITENDIRVAIREYPELFGKPSEAAIDDAVSLMGVPPIVQNTIAIGTVADFFKKPGFFATLQGKGGTKAIEESLNKAKKDAVQDLIDRQGEVSFADEETGKTVNKKLNTDQLRAVVDIIDTVTLEDVEEY